MNFIGRKLVPASAAIIIMLSASLALIPPQQAQAYTCPTTSTNSYQNGIMYRYQQDYKRPAYNHPDKTLYMRGNTPTSGTLGYVDFGASKDTKAPQFATLFSPSRVPTFLALYHVPEWNWGTPPNPGSPKGTFESHALPGGYLGEDVTVLGVATSPGEVLRSPTSGYDLGSPWGKGSVILYADSTNDHAITLHFTREDSMAAGYSIQIQGVCVDPKLQTQYNAKDSWPGGARYKNSSFQLPGLMPGQVFGTAMGTEIKLVMRDKGAWMDPRDKNDWWRIRPAPVGPTLINPENGSETTDLTPQFDWGPVPSPTDYQIEIDGAAPISLGASTLTYTPGSDMALGTHSWHVRGGPSLPWSATWSFTIDLRPPVPTPIAPSGTSNNQTPVFEWTGSSVTTNYALALSGPLPNSDGSITPAEANCDADTSCSFAPGWTLTTDGAYSFTVTAFNGFGNKGPSAARSFTVDTTPPAVPYNNSPKHKVVTVNGKPRLSAKKVSDAAQYHFEVTSAGDPGFSSVLRNGTVGTGAAWTVDPALGYGKYLWRVSAIDAAGNPSTPSFPFELTVSRMKAPKNDSATTDTTPKFTWSKLGSATNWDLRYVRDPDPTDGSIPDPLTDGSSVAVDDLPGAAGAYTVPGGSALVNGVYYWMLRFNDSTNWMPAQKFTVSRMKTLKDKAVTSDTTPRFTWSRFTGATDLQLSIGANSDPSANTPLIPRPPTATSYTVPGAGALPYGVYFWALSGNGGADWLPAWKFTVTRMKSPADEALLTDRTPTFKWVKVPGVSMYHLYIDIDSTPSDQTPVTLGPTAKKYTVPGSAPLARKTTYYWQLTADLSGGGTVSLPVWSFVER